MVADELGDFGVRLRTCRHGQLLAAQVSQGRLRQDVAHTAHPAHHALQVVLIGQEVRVHQRQGHGVGTGQGHPPPAAWLQQAHMR